MQFKTDTPIFKNMILSYIIFLIGNFTLSLLKNHKKTIYIKYVGMLYVGLREKQILYNFFFNNLI